MPALFMQLHESGYKRYETGSSSIEFIMNPGKNEEIPPDYAALKFA